MALTYDLALDFGITSQEVLANNAYTSTAPYWIIAIIRYKQVVTYNRATKSSYASGDTSALIAEAGRTLIITSDCTSLSTTSSKNSHVTNMNATLMDSEVNYLTEVLPGDWVFAWMLQSEDQGRKVLAKIQNSQAANGFQDGLKFIGKVYGMRKSLDQSPDGMRTVRYSLQANGFTEFDAAFFFDPKLGLTDPNLLVWLSRLQIELTNFIKPLDSQGNTGIDINEAIPSLTELLLGRGIPQQAANPGSFPSSPEAGLASTTDAPYAFVIPSTVGKLLGSAGTNKPLLGYSDIFEAIYGVQKYQDNGGGTATQQTNPSAIFLPNGTNTVGKTRRPTSTPMLGSFLPNIPQFQDTTVWTVLSQYLNSTVNEMYTTLRVNAANQIVPTFIVRQLPFSTSIYASTTNSIAATSQEPLNTGDFAQSLDAAVAASFEPTGSSPIGPLIIPNETVTEFLELPRWVAPAAIVYKFDVGRSNAMRFNFVYLAGQADGQKIDPNLTTIALIQNPPVRDDADIKRNGLRMARNLVACNVTDVQLGPRKWMEIKADILMGQHLTLSGTVELQGIQAPICIGDNFEFDDVVFHIETVTHVCLINGGKKYFHTALQIANGLNAKPNISQPQTLYAGMTAGDQRTYDPGLTYQTDQQINPSDLRSPPQGSNQ